MNKNMIEVVLLKRARQQLEGALNTLTDIYIFYDFDIDKDAPKKVKEIEQFTLETVERFKEVMASLEPDKN